MKKYFIVLIAAIICIIKPISAFADEAYSMPPIEDRSTDLTIYFYVEHDNTEIPISGAEIVIYKIADISCVGGSPEYTLFPEYRDDKDINFNGMTASQSSQLAKELSSFSPLTQYSQTTGTDGYCRFFDLPHGMYLVKEVNAQGDAAKYETMEPYLVSLPLGFQSENDSYWKYDVTSEPKTKIIRKTDTDSDSDTDTKTTPGGNTPTYVTPTPTYYTDNAVTPTPLVDIEKVKTGVVTHLKSLIAILILSMIIIALTRDKEKNNK